MGYPTLKGGNGTGPTKPQQILAGQLGWPMEFPVSVKPKKPGLPTAFKIDIAEPMQKLAIEVDGHSHSTARVREMDAKKTAYLESQGLTVLRFKNQEILRDLEAVVKTIMAAWCSI
jgi:hypothetical protein